MFYVGILARRNNWFESGKKLRESLDIPVWLHRAWVLIEAISLILLLPRVDTTPAGIGYAVACFGVAGLFCVDMSILVLDVFQIHADSPLHGVSRFLSDAAYGVYVIHPIVIVGCTAIFVSL